jgi:hypothetical protein
MPVRSSETRRIRSLLGQRRVSDVVMVAILSVALLAGLVGFAVRVLWIAAIVVLGLGYVVANARQDRREAIGQHRDRADGRGQRDPSGAHSGRVLSLMPHDQ